MKKIAAVLLMLIVFGSFCSAETLFVSPAGNDDWSGSLAEPAPGGKDGPLATLEAARLKIKASRKGGSSQPKEVQIRGGEYSLRETVVFGPEDSGRTGAPVVYKAYPGEQPVFTGGVEISRWKKCKKDPAGTPEAARGKLWVAEIPKASGENWIGPPPTPGQR